MARLSAFCTIASPTLAAQITTSSANARVIGSICHRRKERPRNSSRIPSFASGLPCINQRTNDDTIPPNAEGCSVSGADFAICSGFGVGFGCESHGSTASATGAGDGSCSTSAVASTEATTSGAVGTTPLVSATGACATPRSSSSSTRRCKAASSTRTAALRLSAAIATSGPTTSPQNKITAPKISRSSMFSPSLFEEGAE